MIHHRERRLLAVKSLLLCYMLFFGGHPLANTVQKEEVVGFKPFMVGHQFEGCPANSLCSKEAGQLRQRWIHTLKKGKKSALKSFFNEYGTPVGLWTKGIKSDNPKIVSWNSPCFNHRKKNEKIYESEIFLKHFQEITDHSFFIGNKVSVLHSGKKNSYTIPIKELPVFIKDKKLYFHREENGFYYALSVSLQGEIVLENYVVPEHLPKNIECPEILKDNFLTSFSPDYIYEGQRCKNIWNVKSKSFVPMIYGWDCSR